MVVVFVPLLRGKNRRVAALSKIVVPGLFRSIYSVRSPHTPRRGSVANTGLFIDMKAVPAADRFCVYMRFADRTPRAITFMSWLISYSLAIKLAPTTKLSALCAFLQALHVIVVDVTCNALVTWRLPHQKSIAERSLSSGPISSAEVLHATALEALPGRKQNVLCRNTPPGRCVSVGGWRPSHTARSMRFIRR